MGMNRSRVARYLSDAVTVLQDHLAEELTAVNGAEATAYGFTESVPGLASSASVFLGDAPRLGGRSLPVIAIDDAREEYLRDSSGAMGVKGGQVVFVAHCYTSTAGGVQTPALAMELAWRFASAVEACIERRLPAASVDGSGYGAVTCTRMEDTTRSIEGEGTRMPHAATTRKISLEFTTQMRLRHSRGASS